MMFISYLLKLIDISIDVVINQCYLMLMKEDWPLNKVIVNTRNTYLTSIIITNIKHHANVKHKINIKWYINNQCYVKTYTNYST